MMENEFGAKLKSFRQENFLTQEQMAKLLGLSTNHVGSLERGLKQPRASTLAAFEEVSRRSNRGKMSAMELNETLNGKEVELYAGIWRGLNGMESERKKEFIRMIYRMLEWM